MKNYVIVAVLANGKDMGWIKFSTITGRNWETWALILIRRNLGLFLPFLGFIRLAM